MIQEAIYTDATRPIQDRLDDLINRMTIEEKVGQLCQIDGQRVDQGVDIAEWITKRYIGSVLHMLGDVTNELQQLASQTRLGIPVLFGIDAIHGNALHPDAVVFPTQLALASSWNPELVERVGRITAQETVVTGAHWTFSPVCDVARDLRWGRINEGFGEDPYLVGALCQAMIRGYQGEDIRRPDSILACAKHFAGYSEGVGGRDAIDAELSERKLRALHLKAFRAAVDAGCKTIMAGYHAVDGTPCSANDWLLKTVLRDEWGFEGLVITDYDNTGQLYQTQFTSPDIRDAAQTVVAAGNDMIMHTLAFYDTIVEMVRAGEIDLQAIDTACRRILRLKFEMGLFDERRYAPTDQAAIILNAPVHQEVARAAAYESIVLLKNSENILPLPDTLQHIAVIGPNADHVRNQLGDWVGWSPKGSVDGSQRPRENTVTVLDGIRARFGGTTLYHQGCVFGEPSDDLIEEAAQIAEQADLIIAVVGDDLKQFGEYHDRGNLDLDHNQQRLLHALKDTGKPIIVILINSKPLTIPWTADNADALLVAWNPGNEGGTAIASILFGDQAPMGRLPISFPYHVGQQPVYYNQMPGWHGGKYVDLPPEPLFAFGYGLSYTTVAYSDLRVLTPQLSPDETLHVQVRVHNTGKFDTVEVVQLYVNDCISSVTTPIKELKAFARVPLAAGEGKIVDLRVPFDALAIIDRAGQAVVEPGKFEVMVGASSRDADLLRAVFEVSGA